MTQRAEAPTIPRPLVVSGARASRCSPTGSPSASRRSPPWPPHFSSTSCWRGRPHEDETLALFVGRDSLLGLLDHVTRERGGAPLHFLLAWAVAHLGFGLGGLRLVSAAFAVASLPLVALLATAAHRARGLR